MDKKARIYVTGHTGMVGSAVCRRLHAEGYGNVLTTRRREVDLCDAAAVRAYMQANKPDAVVIAAARVGGIHANNTYPAEFIQQNLAIAMNAIHSAYEAGVPRVLFLGSTCIYPRECPQPIKEEYLLTGPLEATNEAYAIAKIAGLKLCQFYRQQYGVVYHSVMPTNLYGPGDNYHPQNSHVLPALIRRFHEAKESGQKEVVLWGTGTPRREFLHADDAASAIIHLLQMKEPPDLVNIGTGEDLPIRELADRIAKVVGYEGSITQDTSKPDGTPRKLCDVSRLFATGWRPSMTLDEGLTRTYQSFLKEKADGTIREN